MIRLFFRSVHQITQKPSRLPVLCWRPGCAPQQNIQSYCQCRWYSKSIKLTDGEKALIDKLKKSFPGTKHLEVSDISGGCGAMYQISIEAEEFKGKKTVMQHRMVNEALAEDIKAMHGLQLNTKAPADS